MRLISIINHFAALLQVKDMVYLLFVDIFVTRCCKNITLKTCDQNNFSKKTLANQYVDIPNDRLFK